jgi:hypothetical protein
MKLIDLLRERKELREKLAVLQLQEFHLSKFIEVLETEEQNKSSTRPL